MDSESIMIPTFLKINPALIIDVTVNHDSSKPLLTTINYFCLPMLTTTLLTANSNNS